jgi:hypothetical protein
MSTMSSRPLRRCRRAVYLVLAAGMLASFALTATAFAVEPTGDFAKFKQCPRFTTGVEVCLYSETLSGEVTLNKQTVPIEKTIVLQGGITNFGTSTEHFVGALNGETLSKTPENVPGGLAGLINCTEIKGSGLLEILARTTCKTTFENGVTGVTAVTELAKPASEIGISTENLENREGTALSLPVKVHLENPLLGSSCYIGSNSNPMTLNLTTGTTSPPEPNKPISGKVGVVTGHDEFNLLEVENNTLVDNAFAAPEATGCGGLLAIVLNPIVNVKLGLPSAAGKNTAIQNNLLKEATGEGVIASEK